MASTGPSVSVGLTLAALAAAAAYAGGVVLVLTAIPMLVIANAYRRLNLWNANCGASFEWVGRAINPYLGFLTGWLMLAGTLIGTLSPVVVIGPSVLAVFGATTASPWPNVGIATGVGLVMLVIAVVGIRLTAQTQVALGVTEYLILVGFAVWGLARVLGHSSDSFPVTRAWFSLHGIGGKGSLAAGFLLAVFMYTGWDGTLYVNEEVKHRRVAPGRAAMAAVGVLAVLYTLIQVGLQGIVSPRQLRAHSASVLVYTVQSFGGTGWGRLMAVAVALSVIATTGVGIALTARIIYGMATWLALSRFLANVSRRHATPVAASVLTGALLLALVYVYILGTGLRTAFND